MERRLRSIVLHLALLPASAFLISPSPSINPTAVHCCRAPSISCQVAAIVDEVLELKEELLELVDEEVEEGTRGVGAPSELAEDILEIVEELDDDGRGAIEWNDNPVLAGAWRLIYTSSKTFANNEGLSGYARDLGGVSTPELFMSIENQFQRLTFEEPLTLEEGSFVGLVGKFANAESVKVECTWSAPGEQLLINSQRVVVGTNSWPPADRQDKAVRTLGASRPVFLDDEILVLRSQPDYVCWIFERANMP
jgi:hypothetical protein